MKENFYTFSIFSKSCLYVSFAKVKAAATVLVKALFSSSQGDQLWGFKQVSPRGGGGPLDNICMYERTYVRVCSYIHVISLAVETGPSATAHVIYAGFL
jgi:hypothetical protein